MAIKSRQLVLLRHREAVGGAVLDAVAAENADAEVDGVVAQLLLLRGFFGGLLSRLLGRLLRRFRLLRLLIANQTLTLGLAADTVGLRVDDARGMALDADPQGLGEIERLGIGHAELSCEFVDADVVWH